MTKRPKTLESILAVGACLALGTVCLLAGCRGQADLGGLADAVSAERLASLPQDVTVLLSLHGEALPAELPSLGEGGRRLGGFGGSALVVAARGALPDLAGLPGVERIVVWGAGKSAARLDPLLRDDILSRLDGGAREAESLPAIGTFAGEVPERVAELEALGVRVGSRSGRIVTLEAPPQTLLDLLARNDLMKLDKPSLQQPSAIR